MYVQVAPVKSYLDEWLVQNGSPFDGLLQWFSHYGMCTPGEK